jgi:hypothetical protein
MRSCALEDRVGHMAFGDPGIGETEQRLYLLDAWEEAPFTPSANARRSRLPSWNSKRARQRGSGATLPQECHCSGGAVTEHRWFSVLNLCPLNSPSFMTLQPWIHPPIVLLAADHRTAGKIEALASC